ncbi:MAG: ATP-dependent RecD-like DNA helicase [Oscillospiraceae bacterium]
MNEEPEKIIISGTVEDIKFRNDLNGYTVLEISCDDELITAVGVCSDISVGESVKMSGEWSYHSTFGRQFKADAFERSMPATTEQLFNYLAAGAIKGIGPATAQKIIEKFGDKSFEILENEPEQLATINGISLEKARKMSESYRQQFAVRAIMMSLEAYGMTPNECILAYKQFGTNVVKMVLNNPYDLTEVSGIGFERAEFIAEKLPNPPENSFRIKAGIVHIVKENLYRNGHTCLPRNKLIDISADYLRTNKDTIDILIDELSKENKLVVKIIQSKEFVFLLTAYNDEKSISDRIKVLLKFPPPQKETLDKEIEKIEKKDKIEYEEKQKDAIRTAINKGILILTGGPGTGKTTTLKGILRLFQNDKLNISLAAPTGRAAKRMTELTGEDAKTIHRLLEVEWDDSDKPLFKRNMRNPLDCEALIVDELSMVDINLFASLLAALPFGCRLIMVGDSDQLPPVGAGNVLSDLIGSGLLPVVELKEVFRQARQSLIVTNAHKIVKGEEPITDKKDGDFFLMERQSPMLAAKTIAELYSKRLPEAYSYSPFSDIQVLCPSRKGEVGSVNLNTVLQSIINPYDDEKRELNFGFRIYREGDKVMQIKNNYNITWSKGKENGEGIFNGDIGIIEKIDIHTETLKINYDDRIAVYAREQLNELELAYAVTVHKSQGSEFKAVIMPAISTIPQLKYRNLLYTAVTRAKELMIIVGTKGEVMGMISNDKKTKRYSALKYLLLE